MPELPVALGAGRCARACRRNGVHMEILLLLIPISVLLVFGIGAVFWWSVASGQFDDLEGPAHRILADDDTSDVIPPSS